MGVVVVGEEGPERSAVVAVVAGERGVRMGEGGEEEATVAVVEAVSSCLSCGRREGVDKSFPSVEVDDATSFSTSALVTAPALFVFAGVDGLKGCVVSAVASFVVVFSPCCCPSFTALAVFTTVLLLESLTNCSNSLGGLTFGPNDNAGESFGGGGLTLLDLGATGL